MQDKERRELIRLEDEVVEKRHKFKMEELVYARESERLNHENELTRIRIKSAEIRKNLERKESAKAMKNYHGELINGQE